jgi:ankyrin repeat protein|tara:strand:+ start:107 stop:451 length:345 start_codon:yes stop_codon:yes gene_type:complete
MGLLGKKKPKPEEIYEAVKLNKKTDVESLLAAKCDPNAFKDQFTGDVCLHVAANKGRTEIIAMLLSGGAIANLQNKVRPSSATMAEPGVAIQPPAGPCLRRRPQLGACYGSFKA